MLQTVKVSPVSARGRTAHPGTINTDPFDEFSRLVQLLLAVLHRRARLVVRVLPVIVEILRDVSSRNAECPQT